MHLLVETNFLLELVFEHEQAASCQKLIDSASRKEIALYLPAFSLMEAVHRLEGLGKKREELLRLVQEELGQAERRPADWHQTQQLRRDFTTGLEIRTVEQRARLRAIGQTLTGLAELVPLTADIWAKAFELNDTTELTLPDSMVCSSLLARLGGLPKEEQKIFVTRDQKGFGEENIRQLFQAHNCKVMFHFEHVCQKLRL